MSVCRTLRCASIDWASAMRKLKLRCFRNILRKGKAIDGASSVPVATWYSRGWKVWWLFRSMSSTSTDLFFSLLATSIPPKPPPTITTRGNLFCLLMFGIDSCLWRSANGVLNKLRRSFVFENFNFQAIQRSVELDLARKPAIIVSIGQGVEHIELIVRAFAEVFQSLQHGNMARCAQGHAAAGGHDVVFGSLQHFHQAQLHSFGHVDRAHLPIGLFHMDMDKFVCHGIAPGLKFV